MKKIIFLTKYGISKDQNGNFFSKGASARLRLLPCAIAASKLKNFKIEILTIADQISKTQIDYLKQFDVIFISKITDPFTLEVLANLSNTNKIIISDFCDNRFEESELSKHYKSIAENSSLITVNTKTMNDVVDAVAPKIPKIIISDPVEGKCLPPKSLAHYRNLISNIKRLDLFWFGHQDGIKNLMINYSSLLSASLKNHTSLRLTILTGLTQEIINFFESFNYNEKNIVPINFHNWSPELMYKFSNLSDITYIPMPTTNFNKTKSPNRLLQSLWLGLPTIASPIESYNEFQDFCYLNEDFLVGFDQLCNDQDIESRIVSAQKLIQNKHSYEAISREWQLALRNI